MKFFLLAGSKFFLVSVIFALLQDYILFQQLICLLLLTFFYLVYAQVVESPAYLIGIKDFYNLDLTLNRIANVN